MKRIVALFLAGLVCFASTSYATGLDVASMTVEELHETIDRARNELTRREMVLGNKTVLVDQNGVEVYLTGEYRVWGKDNVYLDLNAVVINDSNRSISIHVDSVSINGWMVAAFGITDTAAGKKKKDNFTFEISEADISTYEEVEEIELCLTLYDGEEWETVARVAPVVLQLNKEN